MGWVYIQPSNAGAQNTGTTASLTVNPAISPVAGNTCFLAVGWSGNVGTAINSVTDNLGGTWTRTATGMAQSFIIVDLYYRENVPSGITAVTINGNGTLYLSGVFVEFSGGASSNSLDGTVGAGASTGLALISAGPYTPTQDEELILVLGGDDSGGFVETAGPGFILLPQFAGAGTKSNIYFEYKVLFDKSTTTCAFGLATTRAPWAAFAAGFKAAPDIVSSQLNYALVG